MDTLPNVRPGLKYFTMTNAPTYFVRATMATEKKFYNIGPRRAMIFGHFFCSQIGAGIIRGKLTINWVLA
jgi:hypothetical protein